jgi:hypothetical protein
MKIRIFLNSILLAISLAVYLVLINSKANNQQTFYSLLILSVIGLANSVYDYIKIKSIKKYPYFYFNNLLLLAGSAFGILISIYFLMAKNS